MSLAVGNKFVVLVTGTATSGKSSSLMNMPQQENIAYFNTDLKEIPFQNKLRAVSITEPNQILGGITEVENIPEIHTAAIDTITHLMAQYETQHVIGSPNTQKAWGEYGAFYRTLVHKVKSGTKNYVIFTHEADKLNEKEMVLETKSPIKGAVGKIGVEADFSIILSAKRLSLAKIQDYAGPLLNITEEDKENGFKYVFATRIDADSIGEKTRSPMGMWDRKEKYIDNDLKLVFKRLHDYYGKL